MSCTLGDIFDTINYLNSDSASPREVNFGMSVWLSVCVLQRKLAFHFESYLNEIL